MTPNASGQATWPPLLAPPAHLIETDCCKRADEGEAGGEREQQRQHSIAECQPTHYQADHRVDDAEEDNVGAVSREVIEASGQNLPEVGYRKAPDLRERSALGSLQSRPRRGSPIRRLGPQA